MSISNVQRRGFEDRLDRIKQGGANTMGEVHIGPRDEVRAKEGKSTSTVRLKKSGRKKAVTLGEGSNAVLVPLAVILGGVSMFVGQSAAFHLFAEGGLLQVALPVPALEPYVPYTHFAVAGILALMFGWTFRLTSTLRRLALIGGLAAVVYFQADIMQRIPGIYASFFSKAYVAEALAAI